ncbi:putative invertase inhibitor [Bienertia sinuspersici]
MQMGRLLGSRMSNGKATVYISQTDPTNVYYEYCVLTFGLDPRSLTSTAPQLAQIAFELSISRIKDIMSTIDRLRKLSTADPLGGSALNNCFAVYSGVPNGLEAGLEALKGGDYDAASVSVTAAMNAANTCGSGIKERRGDIGPLTKETTDFYQLSAILLGFTKLLRIIN